MARSARVQGTSVRIRTLGVSACALSALAAGAISLSAIAAWHFSAWSVQAVPTQQAGYISVPALLLMAAIVSVGLLAACVVAATLRRHTRTRGDLIQSESRFRTLVEATSDWMWELSADGRYTFVSPRANDILGHAPEDLLGKRPKELLTNQEWTRVKSLLAPYLRNGIPSRFIEVEVQHPSGRKVYVESMTLPIMSAKGEILGYRGVDRDITARKLAEEALRQSEWRLAEAQAVAHMGSGEWDLELDQMTWSRGVYRILGLSPTNAQPSFARYWRCVPMDERPSLLRVCAMARLGKHVARYEHSLVLPDGSQRTVQIRLRNVRNEQGQVRRVIGTIQDVSEQKQIEQRLRESESRLWWAVEHMPILFHAFDDESRFVVWNRQWERVTGYSKASMIGDPCGLDRLFPDPAAAATFRMAWHGQAGTDEWEMAIRCKDGTERTVVWTNLSHAFPIAGWASWGIGVDVTERRRVDAERKLMMTAIDQVIENVIVVDTEGNALYANPAFESTTGYAREEIVHQLPQFLCGAGGGDSDEVLAHLQRGLVWQGRVQTRRQDGTIFSEEITISPVRDAQGTIRNYVRVGRDVTREMQLQAQLRQRQKLEALGTLAGGVAHDFNNLLMPIMGFTELMMEHAGTGNRNEGYHREILSASLRARDIVRQMLTFSRQGEAECQPVQTATAVREALRLIRASIPSTVEILEDIALDGELVWADPTQIHQILMNVCTNSFHAMDNQRGTITVSLTSVTASDALDVVYPPLNDGVPYLKLTVMDTGSGMDQATLDRIFDPFFTTKPLGQGTGLGLATVHGIVMALKGSVAVRSELGKGTEFEVYLPQYVLGDRQRPEAPEDVPRGHGEQVLLVDDEVGVLDATRELVGMLGYHVTAVNSSTEALSMVRAEPERYALLLTDQTMPGMTGAQLAAAVRQVRSDLPIILATGFSEALLPEHVASLELRAVLRKPYSKVELAEGLYKALNIHEVASRSARN